MGMGPRKGRGTGIRELGRLPPLLHKAKEVLKVGYTCQHASRCKSLFLKNDSDHRRMHVIEQVLSKVRGSQKVGGTRDLSSCLVNGFNDTSNSAAAYWTSQAMNAGKSSCVNLAALLLTTGSPTRQSMLRYRLSLLTWHFRKIFK